MPGTPPQACARSGQVCQGSGRFGIHTRLARLLDCGGQSLTKSKNLTTNNEIPTMSNRSFSLASLLVALTLAPVAMAQTPVTVRCTPTDGSAAGCYYCPGFEHVIKLVGTQMHSSTVNLLAFHDQDVLVTGTWNGAVIEVASAQLITESFSIGGNGQIGGRFDFSVVAPSGSLAVNCMAFAAGFAVPAADLAFQLNPATTMVLGLGTIGNGGEFKTRLDIPNDTSLIGVRVFGQGLVAPTAAPAYTTNVDAKDIG